MMENSYNEIKFPAKGIYKDKGSKFIAYAISIYSEDQIKIESNQISKDEVMDKNIQEKTGWWS